METTRLPGDAPRRGREVRRCWRTGRPWCPQLRRIRTRSQRRSARARTRARSGRSRDGRGDGLPRRGRRGGFWCGGGGPPTCALHRGVAFALCHICERWTRAHAAAAMRRWRVRASGVLGRRRPLRRARSHVTGVVCHVLRRAPLLVTRAKAPAPRPQGRRSVARRSATRDRARGFVFHPCLRGGRGSKIRDLHRISAGEANTTKVLDSRPDASRALQVVNNVGARAVE
mmetsp:Transcript_10749/g.31883  ORF Transcript_10749/g.31883 Transcript_10749/m.31883 type:complete len:229 (-) Transcript_10749:162-848(-)